MTQTAPAANGEARRQDEAVISQAQSYGVAAIDRLNALMDHEDARISLAAATALLERAFGKPGLRVESGPVHEPITEVRRIIVRPGDVLPEDR